HARDLLRHGYVVIEGYLSPEECDRLRVEVEGVVAQTESLQPLVRDDGYKDYLLSSGTLVQVRGDYPGGLDSGMLEVFDLERSLASAAVVRDDGALMSLVSAAAGRALHAEVGAFVNRGVT